MAGRRCLAAAVLACVLMGGAWLPGPAAAAPQCDDRDNVIEVLRQKYHEEPVALGVTHNGGLVEVLTTGNGSTWSIIVTTPQGMSCLVAAGQGWRGAPVQQSADPEA